MLVYSLLFVQVPEFGYFASITTFMTKIRLHILHHNTSNCKPTLIYFIFNISEYIFLFFNFGYCVFYGACWSQCRWHDCYTARGQKITYAKDPHTSSVFLWDKLNGAVIIEGGCEKSGSHIIFS